MFIIFICGFSTKVTGAFLLQKKNIRNDQNKHFQRGFKGTVVNQNDLTLPYIYILKMRARSYPFFYLKIVLLDCGISTNFSRKDKKKFETENDKNCLIVRKKGLTFY